MRSCYAETGKLSPIFSVLIFFKIYLFILVARALGLCTSVYSGFGQWGQLSSCSVRSRGGGFPCCGAQASVFAALGLRSCSSQPLEHRLNSCGTWN